MLRQNKIKQNNYSIITLLTLVFFLNIKGFGQTGSNEYYFAYYYELKDSSKHITDYIHISNILSRKFKYYYLISKELGIDIRFKLPLESKYSKMKFNLEYPNKFESDSVNKNSLTNCFDDILNPLVIDISKPKVESNLFLKNDSLLINSINLSTNKSFLKNENYRYSVFFSHDDPSPIQIDLKGFIMDGELVMLNGFFFFDNISSIINDSLINETLRIKSYRSLNEKIELYYKLLQLRGIEYQFKKARKSVYITFPQYKITIKLEKSNIDSRIDKIIKGGNIYETVMKDI